MSVPCCSSRVRCAVILCNVTSRPGPRTFPSSIPIFSLDRVWVAPKTRLRRVWVHRTSAARVASDHLPVLAELLLEKAFATGAAEPAPVEGTLLKSTSGRP